MQNSPQGRKPSVRWFARHFGVNQPSIIKSLEGWEGIQRNAPEINKTSLISRNVESPVKIEEFTTQVPKNLGGQNG